MSVSSSRSRLAGDNHMLSPDSGRDTSESPFSLWYGEFVLDDEDDEEEDDDDDDYVPTVHEKRYQVDKDDDEDSDDEKGQLDEVDYEQGDYEDDDEENKEDLGGSSETLRDHGNYTDQFVTLQMSPDVHNMYALSQKLASYSTQVKELVRKRQDINRDLSEVRKRQKTAETQFEENEQEMRAERHAAGISDELWREYEAFCETLQRDELKGRMSFDYNEGFNDSYIKYDPEFKHFRSAVGDAFDDKKHWRCECVASYSRGGVPIGFHVEYWTFKDSGVSNMRTRGSKLRELALDAARKGSSAALDLLVALPAYSYMEYTYFFEFGFKDSCSPCQPSSQRWNFKTAYRDFIPREPDEKRNLLIAAYDLPFEET